MKKRIAHIIYSGFGGTTDYIFNLVRGDRNCEYEQSIIFYGIEQTSANNLEFARSICANVSVVIKKTGRDKNALAELRSILEKFNPSTITLHVNSLIVDKKKWAPKNSCIIFIEHQSHALKKKKEWLFSIIAQFKADFVVSLTEESQSTLKKKIRLVYKKSKNKIIISGIMTGDFKCDAEKNIVKIGMAGRINSYRDHETLILAFLKSDDKTTELHLAGDGPLLEELKNKYASDRIIFHGFLDRKGIVDFLASLTLYVHASLGETSSVAILQAQASSLPIIASDVSGIRNSLGDSAILVPAKNVDLLHLEINRVLKNETLRLELIEKSKSANQNTPNSFDMFEAYKKLFQ